MHVCASTTFVVLLTAGALGLTGCGGSEGSLGSDGPPAVDASAARTDAAPSPDAGVDGTDAGVPSATIDPNLLEQARVRPLGVGSHPIAFAWPSEVEGDVEVLEVPQGLFTGDGADLQAGSRVSNTVLSSAPYTAEGREPGPAGALRFAYQSPLGERVEVAVAITLELHACDELGAEAIDAERYAPGYHLEDSKGAGQPNVLDPDAALPACESAHAAYPNVARFAFQLARSHWRLGNYEMSLGLAQEAMESGYPAGVGFVAFHYLRGTGVAQDYERAFELFSMAAELGDIGGLHAMALMLQDGTGVEADPAAALAPLIEAAEWGFHWSQNRLGAAHRDGFGTPVDYVVARQWYERAAAQNNVHSLHNLGVFYLRGRGVTVDGVLAEMYLLRGAEHDLEWSHYNLGILYRDGSTGVAPDRDKAIDYLTRAAAAGVQPAQNALDMLQ